MLITTRPATAEDLEFARCVHHAAYREVVELQFGTWDEGQQDGFFLAAWSSASVQIIERDGVPVGCFSVQNGADHLYLAELQVLPNHQGNGIGTRIIQDQLAHATTAGLPLRLQVLHKNLRARQLYERLGFTVCSETARHFEMEHIACRK